MRLPAAAAVLAGLAVLAARVPRASAAVVVGGSVAVSDLPALVAAASPSPSSTPTPTVYGLLAEINVLKANIAQLQTLVNTLNAKTASISINSDAANLIVSGNIIVGAPSVAQVPRGTGNIVMGPDHDVRGDYNLVIGRNNSVVGYMNVVAGSKTVVSGSVNGVFGSSTTVVGGVNLVGGAGHNISGQYDFAYGVNNTLGAHANTCMVGGYSNTIGADVAQSAIVSGASNTIASGMFSSIVSSYGSLISASRNSFIGAGEFGTIDQASYSSIVSGSINTLYGGGYSAIVTGVGNWLSSRQSAVVAGQDNRINSTGFANFIAAGTYNIIGADAQGTQAVGTQFSAILGGTHNFVNGSQSAAVSGGFNKVLDKSSAVLSGSGNTVSSSASAIAAGFLNVIAADTPNPAKNSFIGGGMQNTIRNSETTAILAGRLSTVANSLDSALVAGSSSTYSGLSSVGAAASGWVTGNQA